MAVIVGCVILTLNFCSYCAVLSNLFAKISYFKKASRLYPKLFVNMLEHFKLCSNRTTKSFFTTSFPVSVL